MENYKLTQMAKDYGVRQKTIKDLEACLGDTYEIQGVMYNGDQLTEERKIKLLARDGFLDPKKSR